jgi:pimeloyl-ACP methyl ester carboxylesterase
MVNNIENDAIGDWHGKLDVGGKQLPLAFSIKGEEAGILKASLISQGQTIPADHINKEHQHVIIEFKTINGKFEGTLNPLKDTIIGTWIQGNQNYKLELKRGEIVIEKPRSQEPRRPYPYLEREVKYHNERANITLGGTLTCPKQDYPTPAVILISGSGAEDRNETVFGHKPFLVLADYLTRRGITVLRVDDRGIGDSTGNYRESTNADFASDIISGIAYLKNQKEVNPKKIGLIGHSEGGVIAPMVASNNPDVAFIVLMAGPGIPLEEILYMQGELIARANNVSEELIAKQRKIQEIMFSIIKKERNLENAEKDMRKAISDELKDLKAKNLPISSQTSIDAQIKSVLSPWFRDFLTYDPKIALRKVKCAVLALNGEKDLQVPPKENMGAIEQALKESGNSNYKIIELPSLNHLFQTAQTGSVNEYAQIEETIAPVALKVIGDWIIEQSGK